jgi:hypothetical protein
LWWGAIVTLISAIHLILLLLLVIGIVGHLRRRRLEALVVVLLGGRRVLRRLFVFVGHLGVRVRLVKVFSLERLKLVDDIACEALTGLVTGNVSRLGFL